MLSRLLITGGAGFIGSNFIRLLLASGEPIQILNLDKLTYAGNLENLKSVEALPNYTFFHGGIELSAEVSAAFAEAATTFNGPIDAVVHFAAESHVDRSIEDPTGFLTTNVLGTQIMLEAARRHGVQRFLHVSTDEVYGSLGEAGAFSETTPLAPNSPYAASKAASDLIARAYFHTYGFPVVTTRCSNNYGPFQFPEKLIPLMIANALENKPLPVYGDGLNVRDWVHVDDHSRAIWTVLQHGKTGEVYNIGGQAEKTNLEIVHRVLQLLDKPDSLVKFVTDRPGHDRRYAMDISKIQHELGWTPAVSFEEGIASTVQWYVDNPEWVSRVRSGAYQEYYGRHYDHRSRWVQGVEAGSAPETSTQ